ncbi:MAG: hypothetical protein AAFU85_17715 [Planctomycetota bacterium]
MRNANGIRAGFARVALLTVWFVVSMAIVSGLMADHWIPLPRPEGDSFTYQSRGEPANDQSDATRPKAHHFLYGECPCSRRVLDQLLERHALSGVDETIVLVDGPAALVTEASNLGYRVDLVAAAELEHRYGVVSSPLLVVTDASERLLYSGGYTDRKQGFAIRDTEILRKLRSGEHVSPLPVFGCATSRELQARIDPLGLKYEQQP